MLEPSVRVCLIGAGPAGLAAARNLKLRGIPYDQFEKHSGVGGIWDIDNPGTPMYESAHFISSRTQSAYCGFPMPEHYPDYPGRELILDYTKAFAEAYDLPGQIAFRTPVSAIEPDGDAWAVTTAKGQSNRYSHVICASGHTWTPNWPDYPGVFSGEVMHAVDFRSADTFKGKRVLIVGAGNSGCDIACDAARFADETYISMRRGYHFIPKHLHGQPTDIYAQKTKWLPFAIRRWGFERTLKDMHGDLTRYGLEAPDHRILESHPIINSQLIHHLQHGDVAVCRDIARLDGKAVRFKDGCAIEVDLIVYATGYRYQIPYVDPGLFDWNSDKPSLAYTVFNKRHDTLFAAGSTEMNAGGYYIFDEMTSLIADAIKLQTTAPEKNWQSARKTIFEPVDFSGGINFVKSERHADYLDMDTYLNACRRLVKRLGWMQARKALTAMPTSTPRAALATPQPIAAE